MLSGCEQHGSQGCMDTISIGTVCGRCEASVLLFYVRLSFHHVGLSRGSNICGCLGRTIVKPFRATCPLLPDPPDPTCSFVCGNGLGRGDPKCLDRPRQLILKPIGTKIFSLNPTRRSLKPFRIPQEGKKKKKDKKKKKVRDLAKKHITRNDDSMVGDSCKFI